MSEGGGIVNKVFVMEHVDLQNGESANSPEMNCVGVGVGMEHGNGSEGHRQVCVTDAGDAVIIRGGEKSYDKKKNKNKIDPSSSVSVSTAVLRDFDMTVPCGSIYGLLGSSGCGKTTVLSAIVGLLKLDRGDIFLFGESQKGQRSKSKSRIGIPGRNVGYMPQEISLYEEFTVDETLKYFGTLAGLTPSQVERSGNFLLSLLDLPGDSRRVENLSGGQKRRLSFAAALIHGPELLILDEPTVGVDPLVRQNIWKHLEKLVRNERTTVIITTHYIEECRPADNVGIMRNGRLMTEKPPDILMKEHGSNNLEKIVLTLAKNDAAYEYEKSFANIVQKSEVKMDEENTNASAKVKMARVRKLQETGGFQDSLQRIRAITQKNFVILLRNTLLLFFVLVVAALFVVMVCVGIGPNPRNLRLGVVNNEMNINDLIIINSDSNYNYTNYNYNYVNESKLQCDEPRVPGECNVENLSCQFLRAVAEDKDGTVDLVPLPAEDVALEMVHQGDLWGYVVFQEDFSSQFFQRFSNPDESLASSDIIVRLDESSKQISSAIKKALHDGFEEFIKNLLQDCGFDPRQGSKVFQYGTPVFGRDDTDFREFIAPGMALACIFFFPIITTSLRYIREKKSGVLHRSLVGGVMTWEIVVACGISEFLVLTAQSLLNYLVITRLFGIPVLGSNFFIIGMFILSGYGGVSMGFMLGSICSEEIHASILAMAAFFPNFVLAGLLWPVEGMAPEFLQQVVHLLPVTYAAESVRSVTSRGWDFTHPNVWPGCAVLVLYNLGYFAITFAFYVIFKK